MAEELCSCLDTQLKVWLWRIHCHCLTCSNLARLVNSPKELRWLFLFVELMLHRVSRGFLQGMCMNKYVELIINPVCVLFSSLQPLGMRAREDSAVVGELLKSALVPSTVKEVSCL